MPGGCLSDKMNTHTQKIGVALGSGGARGWAHIGVLQAIREHGLHVHCVSGTSMGALVGAAFASGKLDTLHQMALKLDWKRVLYYFFELNIPRMGLIDGTRILEFVKAHISSNEIEQLAIPYAAVATDIMNGEEVILSRGSVIAAVRASVAIPGMLTPLEKDGRLLVDGGLVNPLPVNVARDLGADYVIAVDVSRSPLPGSRKQAHQRDAAKKQAGSFSETIANEDLRRFLERIETAVKGWEFPKALMQDKWEENEDRPNLFDVYGNTMRIFQKQITSMRLQLEPPDCLIQPDVQEISTMDFYRAEDAIEAGYTAANKALKKIQISSADNLRHPLQAAKTWLGKVR